MSAPVLPKWPEDAFCDHGLSGPCDVFIDESGPRTEGTMSLGMLIVERDFAKRAATLLNNFASGLENDHPPLKNRSAYKNGEWKGRHLASKAAGTKARRAINRGELLSDVGRQAVYVRCLRELHRLPRARAFALTYRWTGAPQGPAGIAGYRVQRVIELALNALAYQVVEVQHLYIDNGHPTHYTAGIANYAARTRTTPLPHTFVVSNTDRRIQIADLIAFAAHTARFPAAAKVFPTLHGWLRGFVGDRLITLADEADHYVVEP